MVILSYPLIILTTSIIGMFIFVNLCNNINMEKDYQKLASNTLILSGIKLNYNL